MRQFRVATVTLNPAYDIFGTCQHIELGEVNRVAFQSMIAAGKGINVAKVLHDLGINTTVTGFLGRHNQTDFQATMARYQWDNQFILVEGYTRMNVKLTEQSQRVTDFNFSGFSLSPTIWQHFIQHSLDQLAGFDVVSVNGSLPLGVDPHAFSDWLVALKQVCPYVILDSSQAALKVGMNAKPWLIKPNEKELSEWAGKAMADQATIITTAQQLVETGIEHVVVSMGEAGAIWVSADAVWHAKPPVCHVVSTVGAGDSLVAGLIYGTLMKKTQPETLQLACALSALSVGQSGVGLSDHQQLIVMIPQVELIKIQ